jgi:hypothetical protein
MAGRSAGRTSHRVVTRTGNVSSCTREGRSATRSSLRHRHGADGRGAGSSSGCHVAGSRTSMTCRGHGSRPAAQRRYPAWGPSGCGVPPRRDERLSWCTTACP